MIMLAQSWLEFPDGRRFQLSGNCTIGRLAENDLVLDDVSVSRNHALIMEKDGGYSISDLHSANGTFVNQRLITGPVQLQDGCELRFGDAALKYRTLGSPFAVSVSNEEGRTELLRQVQERSCWLLLADLVGSSSLITELGAVNALRRFQAWSDGLRPLIKAQGGTINRNLGDAIFAWWAEDPEAAERVRKVLAAIEDWRRLSPAVFRLVIHRGHVLFNVGERGDELSGLDVNFLFKAEKIAKTFGAPLILTESAAKSLDLLHNCRLVGEAGVDGIGGRFRFYTPLRRSDT